MKRTVDVTRASRLNFTFIRRSAIVQRGLSLTVIFLVSSALASFAFCAWSAHIGKVYELTGPRTQNMHATQVVLRAAIPHYIIPLDCTNTLPLTKSVFDQIAQHQPQTIITQLFQQTFGPFFGSAPPPFPIFIFDTTAFAYLVHPEFATDVRDLWVDMNTTFDQNYGKSIVYASDPYPSIGLLQDSKVIFHLNNAQFYAFYVDLLTRPVPVKFHGPSHEFDD
jgi:Inosine-uridine preferring nucleoside hydrolase